MARSRTQANGRGDESLEAMKQAQLHMLESMAALNRNQIALVEQHTQLVSRISHIEAMLSQHSQVLETLAEAVAALPDTMGRRFGFKPPEAGER